MKERALSLYPKKLLNVLPSSSGALPCFQGTAVWWVREGDGSSAGEHSQGVTGNVTAQPWISSFVQLHTHPGRPPGEEHPSDGWSPSGLALCWRWCEQQLQKISGMNCGKKKHGSSPFGFAACTVQALLPSPAADMAHTKPPFQVPWHINLLNREPDLWNVLFLKALTPREAREHSPSAGAQISWAVVHQYLPEAAAGWFV